MLSRPTTFRKHIPPAGALEGAWDLRFCHCALRHGARSGPTWHKEVSGMDAVQVACSLLFTLVPSIENPSGRASSDNFVVYAPTQELASEVLQRAESLRTEFARELFGESIPPGVGLTSIHIRLSDNADEGRTWLTDDPKRGCHLVWLSTTGSILPTSLRHEMIHVVLGTKLFGKVPCWADEGLACVYDEPEHINSRQRLVEAFARNGNWPDIRRVLDEPKLADTDHAAYAIAASLTRFFLNRGDHAKFLAFAQSGSRDGWDRALNDHYRIHNTTELLSQWQDWVCAANSATTSRGRNRDAVPSSPKRVPARERDPKPRVQSGRP